MYQTREVWMWLREQHLPRLSEAQTTILALRMVGFSNEQIGQRVGRSASSVHSNLARIQHAVFDVFGLEYDGWLTVFWVGLHRDCCTRRVFEMIENPEENSAAS